MHKPFKESFGICAQFVGHEYPEVFTGVGVVEGRDAIANGAILVKGIPVFSASNFSWSVAY
jgi:hypothetical protein